MATMTKGDHKMHLHFSSDLISVIAAEGFPKVRKERPKDPFMEELEGRIRTGLARQFEKLRPTVRSI